MEISRLYEIFCQHPVVTTDTRDCPEGSIFFALKGAHFDGNRFALQALEAGCAYAVVDDAETAAADKRCILCDNVLTTLQQLAAHHRRHLNTPILQITGTNGKTTTKELVAAVLSERYNVLYTIGNLNNHIGVPKTLLRLTNEHEFAVIETGANHIGEIAALSEIVQPDCALITNVGKAHLEGFGSFEGVIAAKTELYDFIRRRNNASPDENKQTAFIFLPADNPHLVPHAEGLPAFTYGSENSGTDIEGAAMACDPFLTFRWRERGGEWHRVSTRLIGAYNLHNLLAAVAVGRHFGVAPNRIDAALARYAPNNSRSEFRRTTRNRLIIDAYNANLSSMQAALENFRLIADVQKTAILGEMRELGATSLAAHSEVVTLAAAAGCREVWLVGAQFAAADAPSTDVSPTLFRYFSDVEAVKSELRNHPLVDQLILIKGSNGTKLFELPELL